MLTLFQLHFFQQNNEPLILEPPYFQFTQQSQQSQEEEQQEQQEED